MACKKKESERGREQEEDDECMHAIMLTAGAALAMACLKRILELFLVEQWRVKVFILLNLVLLAIFFTSSSSEKNQESKMNNVEMKIEEKKKRNQCECSEELSQVEANKQCHKFSKGTTHDAQVDGLERGQCKKCDIEHPKLTKEELNERVEAFIVMFRQHLVSDARKGRAKDQQFSRPKQREMLSLKKDLTITLSNH